MNAALRLAALVGLSIAGTSCAAAPKATRPIAKPGSTQIVEWRFSVSAGDGAQELAIEATFPAGSSQELSLESGAEPYVRDVAVSQRGTWQAIEPHGTSWMIPSCPREGCRVRYRFLRAKAVDALDDPERGTAAVDGAYFSSPATWLLHPLTAEGDGTAVVDVVTAKGVTFVTGMTPEPGRAGSYRVSLDDLPDAPYSGFGDLRTRSIEVPGGVVELAIARGKLAVGDDELATWVTRSAKAVATYYGRYPVPRVAVMIAPTQRHGLFGLTTGSGGASILVAYGRENDVRELTDDWVLPHEMVHLAMPSVTRVHHWLEEGLATYVEPLARFDVGNVDEAHVWSELVRGLPQGLPQRGDEGLDHTHTWGRTYWGGALFCTLADVELREQTAGKFGLVDALRAVLDKGGSIRVDWPIERVLQVGDEATGTHVLQDLYRQMANDPHPVDVDSLFAQLGVVTRGGAVTFDDSAPLAAVRKSITRHP